jgi:hypothetical protein
VDGATSGAPGGVIANGPAVELVASCLSGPGVATIAGGIFFNTISNVVSGDGGGAVFNAEGATIGAFDAAWAAIGGTGYNPPANAALLTGIVGNAVSEGVASDSGVGLSNLGRISLVHLNTFADLSTADSGGAVANAGRIAYLGRNTITGIAVGDLGGGLLCSNPSYNPTVEGSPRAAIKLVKQNAIDSVASGDAGGCMYFSISCGVQFLVQNNCTGVAVAAPPPLPPVFEFEQVRTAAVL